MKKKVRKCLQLVLILVGLVSTALLLRQCFDNAGSEEAYNSALAIAQQGGEKQNPAITEETQPAKKTQWIPAPVEDDPNMQTMAAMDLEALREVNPDVVGWIWIPDTEINYPVMQGQDNEFYLNHTWEGKKNAAGSIFLEHRNSADFTDYNTIVYGHNMNNGSMFAAVRSYASQWYYQRHPYVYIAMDSGVYRYEVFSSYKASVESSAYGLSFHQDQTKVNFLTEAIKKSQFDVGIRPEITDRILTLSTCSGGGYTHRWVVHARLKMIPVTQP